MMMIMMTIIIIIIIIMVLTLSVPCTVNTEKLQHFIMVNILHKSKVIEFSSIQFMFLMYRVNSQMANYRK